MTTAMLVRNRAPQSEVPTTCANQDANCPLRPTPPLLDGIPHRKVVPREIVSHDGGLSWIEQHALEAFENGWRFEGILGM
jgi:hypothetical protein